MKIEAGKSYITSEGRVAHIELRPEGHWDFIDQHGFCYDERGNCFWEKFKLVSPYVSVIERDDGVPMTLSEVEADVAAAQTKYGQRDYCFTWITVKALVDKIKQLEDEIHQLRTALNETNPQKTLTTAAYGFQLTASASSTPHP